MATNLIPCRLAACYSRGTPVSCPEPGYQGVTVECITSNLFIIRFVTPNSRLRSAAGAATP